MSSNQSLRTDCPLDWSKLTQRELVAALRTIPRMIAYAWQRSGPFGWHRPDVEEYGSAFACSVSRNEDGTWSALATPGMGSYGTLEEAKAACDAELRGRGWILCDELTGPAD